MLRIPYLDSIFAWFSSSQHALDDPTDRLNYSITPSMLVLVALMISTEQYMGSPIQCWLPMEFKDAWDQYAEDYCFIQSTYYLPADQAVPEDVDQRELVQINYYQWIPIVLAFQAIMFCAPNFVWNYVVHTRSEFDMSTAVSDACELTSMMSTQRQEGIDQLADYIDRHLLVDQSTIYSCYYLIIYLVIKFVYLINIGAQFLILNAFIGDDYAVWGIDVIADRLNGAPTRPSTLFPRFTLCDFTVRQTASLVRYTVQCVLMINMFNEKVYLLLWFWLLFLASATSVAMVYRAGTLLYAPMRERHATHYMRTISDGVYGSSSRYIHGRPILEQFIRARMRPDTLLLLTFIEARAGAMVANDLCAKMFDNFVDRKMPTPVDGSDQQLYGQVMSNGVLLQND